MMLGFPISELEGVGDPRNGPAVNCRLRAISAVTTYHMLSQSYEQKDGSYPIEGRLED